MKIAREEFTKTLADEIAPLGQNLWDECSEIKQETCSFHGERGFKVEPDVKQYLHLAQSGGLFAMTLRDDAGVLFGFALCIVYQSLHHAPVKCVNVDSFHVEPPYRAYVGALIGKMEAEFESLGIVVVGWPTSPSGNLFQVLKLLGYAPDDVVMEKRICALQ